jgi:hypothetical protein
MAKAPKPNKTKKDRSKAPLPDDSVHSVAGGGRGDLPPPPGGGGNYNHNQILLRV